jgi:general secretion pathway protein D
LKSAKFVIAAGLLTLVLGCVVASAVAAPAAAPAPAQAAAPSPGQLMDEARKLYASHDYQGALARLQKIDRAKLGWFEQVFSYDPLMNKVQGAISGKAADQKAFDDGRAAYEAKRFAAAVAKLSQASSSEYLEPDKAGAARALLQLAEDEQGKANARAVALINQARGALEAGKTADARKTLDQVKGMDVQLGWMDGRALASLDRDIVAAEKPPAAPAKIPTAVVQAPTPAAPVKAPTAVAQAPTPAAPVKAPTAVAQAPAPAAAPAKAPAAEPKKPAGPTPGELLAQARKQYESGQYDAALKQLKSIKRDDLGWFERAFSFDPLVRNCENAIASRAAAEKALAQGESELAAKRYPAALEKLSQAAESDYLDKDKQAAAKKAYAQAEQESAAAAQQVATLTGTARKALKDGKPADARKAVQEAKSVNVALSWSARHALSGVESDLVAAEAAPPKAPAPTQVAVKAPAPKPAETASVAMVRKPAEETPVKAPAPAPKPLEVAALPAPVGPKVEVINVAPARAAAPAPAAVAVFQQAKRAEAEDEIKLADAALAAHEYEQAKIHFARAQSLWPDSQRAKDGLRQATQFTGEKVEPLGDVLRDVRAVERQRVIADVQELLSQAERMMARAERPEDYNEALRPLAQADRTIDVAQVLSAEEQERLREEVYVLKRQIQTRRAQVDGERSKLAVQEAVSREQVRRFQDKTDRENKVRQLWERATELRKSMQFGESIQVLDRLLAVDPNDERALRWREDLLYLESQSRQVRVRTDREDNAAESLVDTEEAAIHTSDNVGGQFTPLRYPTAKEWKDLTDFRREFTKAVSQEPKAVAEMRQRLNETINLDLEQTTLDNALKYITDLKPGLNIVVDPDIAAGGIELSTRMVNLKVTGVAVDKVLGLIMGADLGYKVESGYILVTTKEKLQQNLPVVTYPVQDLVAQIPDFGAEAPRFEVGDITQAAAAAAGGGGGGFGQLFGAGGGAGAQQPDANVGPQELIDIIQRTVNSQSDPAVAAWSDEGGPAAIEYMNGLLIITQTRRGHEKVAELLEQLRRERAIMINVESRFCSVTDEFLQDITLDVDVAFNNGPFSPARGFNGAPIQNPAAPTPPTYNTLPGVPPDATFPVQQGQPIIVSGTGSNGMGTATLLPIGNTVFGSPQWQANTNQGGAVISGVFLDSIQVGFLLRAIMADVRSTTLQAPRLTLYNGQRSYISVSTVTTYIADVTPVVAQAAVGWDPTIGAIPVGVTLDVKATVSADRRYVQMDLRPQVADIEAFEHSPITAAVPGLGIATATIDLPRVRVQDFKTTVSVPDGGTLLLGGTRQFMEGEAETGVPILSKIPIIRRLFNNRATIRRANNLLILIRPKIIIQTEEEHRLGFDNF